jgi:hypothetical protein
MERTVCESQSTAQNKSEVQDNDCLKFVVHSLQDTMMIRKSSKSNLILVDIWPSVIAGMIWNSSPPSVVTESKEVVQQK